MTPQQLADLAGKLGLSALEAWECDVLIASSTDPEDYELVPELPPVLPHSSLSPLEQAVLAAGYASFAELAADAKKWRTRKRPAAKKAARLRP